MRLTETQRLVFPLAWLGLAAAGASCALPFWSLPADEGASASSTSGQGGAMPECTQPGAPRCGTNTEQCNDGGSFTLDGCDASCGYDVVQRMRTLLLSTQPGPSFCVQGHGGNQFGRALAPIIAIVNQGLADNIQNGNLNVLTHFNCLSDLSGTNASGFTVGVIDGFVDPAKGLWPPTKEAPEDWSFLADKSAVSAGVEKYQLSPASITNYELQAGPSSIDMNFPLAGVLGVLTFDNAKIDASVSTTTSPPTPGPMGLAQNLRVFDGVIASGPGQGLCGDITARSLAQIAVPDAVAAACTPTYTSCGSAKLVGPNCNSMLDVLVGGCTIPNLDGVKPTQPDVPGDGAQVTTLVVDTAHGNKVTVPPGDNDAYSSYFTFDMLRQELAGETCAKAEDCQSGQTCCPSGDMSCVADVCTPR